MNRSSAIQASTREESQNPSQGALGFEGEAKLDRGSGTLAEILLAIR
jgi:hypothetical protein